jgi:hypothetical protein
MRSSTARALLALILLTVALEAVPTEQQATVLQPLTLTATFNIEPGDALAPHIYDWYFDGVDGYVALKSFLNLGVSDAYTMGVWFYALRLATGSFQCIFATDYRVHSIHLHPTSSAVDNRVYHGTRVDRVALVAINANTWYHAVLVAKSYAGAWFYLNGGLRGSISFSDALGDLHLSLALGSKGPNTRGEYFNGYIAQALIYSRALSDSEIAQAYNGVVNANGLVLFLDATFYDGTRYIDLSGRGNHGVGYGGVSRVLSSRPHLYLVKGLHGDGLVHFKFFPVNTVVDVYNATTNSLVASFTVDGPANRAGLVEDYAVSLGPGLYRLVVYTTVYVQVAQPALPTFKLVVAHFKAEIGPGCRVYIDYTAWPKAEPRTECGLQTDVTFITGLPAGATVRVWNETVLYEVTASSTGVAVLGGLKPGAYEVKVYSDTLQIPYDHLLRLDPLTGLRQFFGFWDRLTYNLFTPIFVIGLVLAVYLRTWSTILTALVALAAHIVIAPDNMWIRGLLALALAVAVYIAVWRRTTLI